DLIAKGYTDHIELKWDPNLSDTDMAGYYVYRGICGWDSVCVEWEVISISDNERVRVCTKWEKVMYDMYLIGVIEDPDSNLFWDSDSSLPANSAICYRYTVKSYDLSQNLSDTSNTVCAKLRESEPPPPPVIAALKARDRAVQVEWVTPPIQDLYGFMVERRKVTETSWDTISPKLNFPEPDYICDSIPATNIWAEDCVFVFVDTTAVPESTYFYRVRGADYLGNIGDPSAIQKTYTFDFSQPEQPVISSVTEVAGACALKIVWSPVYIPDYLGFVVFRKSDNSPFRQISDLIRENSFVDYEVGENITYTYKVQYFGPQGNRSDPSAPVTGIVSP
ncbi:hypothetical protein JW877_03025, partial [bacterium]|nr:hypothetical protein [bacterium]